MAVVHLSIVENMLSVFLDRARLESDLEKRRYELEEIRRTLQHDRVVFTELHVGLRNVSARLVLQYGEASRLRIYSHEGRGTDIFFSLPG